MIRLKKNNIRFNSAIRMMMEYEQEPSHVMQINHLVTQLFTELKILHGFGKTEKEMLETAAILHDIGYIKKPSTHHKTSMKMIMTSPLDGWTDEEKQVIGNIARYHRKSFPNPAHKNYASLSPENRERVLKLASILRLADGLDKSHSNAIKSLRCEISSNKVKLHLTCRGDIIQELQGFKKKKALFNLAFGKKIVLGDIKNIWEIGPDHFASTSNP